MKQQFLNARSYPTANIEQGNIEEEEDRELQ